MKIFNFFLKLFSGDVVVVDEKIATLQLEEKDPDDGTKTDNSTTWHKEDYCPSCNKTVDDFNIRHAEYCPYCGHYTSSWILQSQRIVRKIYYQGKWQFQYKLGNTTTSIQEKKY